MNEKTVGMLIGKKNVYEYLELLLTGLAEHADDTNRDFIKDLLPWSENAQAKCKSLKKS